MLVYISMMGVYAGCGVGSVHDGGEMHGEQGCWIRGSRQNGWRMVGGWGRMHKYGCIWAYFSRSIWYGPVVSISAVHGHVGVKPEGAD
jgi:hypothetical protein